MENQETSKHSLYLDIYNKLKNEIIHGKYPPGAILPTEKELAENFYVSRITIQKAMQLLKSEGFISRVPGRGTFVEEIQKEQKQHTIGLILCHAAYSFGLGILLSIERTAAKYGYHLIFKNSVDDPDVETKAINDLVAFGVDGIIIQPIHNELYNETLIQMHFNKLPIVLVDRCFSGFAIPGVSTNNFEAAGALTKYLFDKGHEHIGFICSPQANTSSIQERIDGFTSTHIVNNRSVNDSNILNTIISPHSANDPTAFRKDVDTIKNYLEKNKNITALISTEFTVTQIIMQAVQEIGKNIPEDYSLVMFDGYESVTSPLVTHIRQDQEKIGQIAVETLLARIANKIVGQKIYVPSNIIEGNTVKELNRRKK